MIKSSVLVGVCFNNTLWAINGQFDDLLSATLLTC